MAWRICIDGIPSAIEQDPDDGRLLWVGLFDPLEAATAALNLLNPLRPAIASASVLVAEEGDQAGRIANA